MKVNKAEEAHRASLKRELDEVRRASLIATRRGDYMRVAKLSSQAAGLSRALAESDGMIPINLF